MLFAILARLNRHAHRTERKAIKLILGALGAVVILIGLGFAGYRAYIRFEGDRLTRRAHDYFEAGDTASAALTAARAFQLNQRNAEACRILAATHERNGLSSAIVWRQQVVALAPQSVEDAISLARAALQFGETGVAEGALNKVSDRAGQLASYHEVAGQLAAAKRDTAAAEKEFAEAVRLAPESKLYQLKLALLQLQSSTPGIRDKANATLQHFMDDAELRAPAARALRDYAAQRENASALVEFASRLHDYPEATFRDRLSYVQILRAVNHQDFAIKLADLQNEAAGDPNKLTILLAWMSSNRLAVLAIDWIKRLPAETITQRSVTVAVADCYVGARDWDALVQWCKKTNWHDLEFLRHAYLARAARERGEDFAVRSEWNAAMHDAGADGDRLISLEQTAAKWGWKKEAEDLLWAMGKNPDKQRAALASLNEYYTEKGQTSELYRVWSRLCEISPNDESAQNNLAQISLLLNLNSEMARASAEQLYKKHPESAVYTSTYAFSLYQKGQHQQAVKAMSTLKPDELLDPGVSAYYGIFLAAAGEKAKAAEYLERGAKAKLLPEEKLLVEKARQSIGAP